MTDWAAIEHARIEALMTSCAQCGKRTDSSGRHFENDSVECPPKSRVLTREERIEARHWLQELSERARDARNAMDPLHGVLGLTDTAWIAEWDGLRKNLDSFTERVRTGKRAVGGIGDRNA